MGEGDERSTDVQTYDTVTRTTAIQIIGPVLYRVPVQKNPWQRCSELLALQLAQLNRSINQYVVFINLSINQS